jgi:hypothetical protein
MAGEDGRGGSERHFHYPRHRPGASWQCKRDGMLPCFAHPPPPPPHLVGVGHLGGLQAVERHEGDAAALAAVELGGEAQRHVVALHLAMAGGRVGGKWGLNGRCVWGAASRAKAHGLPGTLPCNLISTAASLGRLRATAAPTMPPRHQARHPKGRLPPPSLATTQRSPPRETASCWPPPRLRCTAPCGSRTARSGCRTPVAQATRTQQALAAG